MKVVQHTIVAKRVTKAAKHSMISSLYNQIEDHEKRLGMKQHGLSTRLVKAINSTVSNEMQITRHDIFNFKRKVKKEASKSAAINIQDETLDLAVAEQPSTLDVVVAEENTPVPIARSKGGRPKGATIAKKRDCDSSFIAARNEIATIFHKEKKKCGKKRMRKGRLAEIIRDVKKRRSLPDDFDVPSALVRKRSQRNNLMLVNKNGRGNVSPLLQYEPTFVDLMIQMGRIHRSLTPSGALALINDSIATTPAQDALIKWKQKHNITGEAEGEVGHKYWQNFKRRNNDKIVTLRGQKFELDRAEWTTYKNFDTMYESNGDEMECAGVAEKLVEPEWQNKLGETVDVESKVFGCKVTHKITNPDMCLVMDEVGNSTSQKGDGAVGGEKFVCAKGTAPKEITNTKDKHWTLIGLTALSGEPVMCVIIFAGEQPSTLLETGMDVFADVVRNNDDADFFENNSGPNKLYPGGPTCSFKGKEVPCLVRWTTKGSINGTILVEMLKTLDELGIYSEE